MRETRRRPLRGRLLPGSSRTGSEWCNSGGFPGYAHDAPHVPVSWAIPFLRPLRPRTATGPPAAEHEARLADAAARGDLAAVRDLLDEAPKTDVNAAGVDGTTALHWAVRSDNQDMAKLLVRAGADATAKDRYGITPLYLAAVNGSAEMIRLLLDAGADPNSVAPTGETALMTATRTGDPSAMRMLLESRRSRGRARRRVRADGVDARRQRKSPGGGEAPPRPRRVGQRANPDWSHAGIPSRLARAPAAARKASASTAAAFRIAAGAPKRSGGMTPLCTPRATAGSKKRASWWRQAPTSSSPTRTRSGRF